MRTRYDAIIIGAGHNSLVAACYLAKEGYKVIIFEGRDTIGGCCSTDETTFQGFKISSAAYVNSLFLPQIIEDLRLKEYGYEVIPREPASFTPLLNGEYLFLSGNEEFDVRQISKFSRSDAARYSEYEATLARIAKFVTKTLDRTPPNMLPRSLDDLKKCLFLAKNFLRLSPGDQLTLSKLFSQSATTFLDSWFDSEPLKATLLTNSTIGAMDFSGYVLLHHVMGEVDGKIDVWGFQRGGMGGLSASLAGAATDLGVEIRTGQRVEEIITSPSGGRAIGIRTEGCQEFANIIVSGADPKTTFLRLVRSKNLNGFREKIRKLDFSSASMKVNLTLSGLPSFRCLPGATPGPQHRGTMHISPSVEYIRRAIGEAKRGIPSTEPILEITIPSVLDNTLAPVGSHVMNIFVQYTPYHLESGSTEFLDRLTHGQETTPSWDELKRRYFEENIMGVLRKYIENIDHIITGVQVISPLDLERDFSLTEGNIFHGAMTLRQLFSLRPVRGHADYRTPIKGLYLCGAGTHPGGGAIGANGLNASREILKDLQG